MYTLATFIVLIIWTIVLGTVVIAAALMGVRHRAGNIMDRAPKTWARALLRASQVDVEFHGIDAATAGGGGHIFVSNHVSWYDVLALAAYLPRYRFVGKAELFRIPIFGPAIRAVGTIPVERENRKAAFASYETAAESIRDGDNVVIFPEGTRGSGYALRPFKKGPFVLAIASQAPVVPTLVHGTVEILPRGSFNVRPGTIHVHFLAPVPTAGMTYDDRDQLALAVHQRMADALHELYGVPSPLVGTRAA